MAALTVRQARLRRHKRVRHKVLGSAERPRLVVFRSNRGISAQLVDDVERKTLAAAGHGELKKTFKGSKIEQAAEVGSCSLRPAKRPASRQSSSTAEAISTTAASRHSPTARAKED